MSRVDLTVPARYRGPQESGNGGWVSGSLARHVTTSSERPAVSVRLSSPPPLDRMLTVTAVDAAGSTVRLLGGAVLVATATAVAGPEDALLEPATSAEAEAAAQRYEGDADHPFPTCFSCGTGREPGDGLRLRPGPLDDGTGRYAAPWTVPDDVSTAVVWAALDCPGGWSAGVAGRPMVLGTMTTLLLREPEPGERTVVTAWQRGSEGRRHLSATTLHDEAGELLGRAEATWIAVDPTTIRPTTSAGGPA